MIWTSIVMARFFRATFICRQLTLEYMIGITITHKFGKPPLHDWPKNILDGKHSLAPDRLPCKQELDNTVASIIRITHCTGARRNICLNCTVFRMRNILSYTCCYSHSDITKMNPIDFHHVQLEP